MKITHIEHSGFLVELDRHVLVFDYWKGPVPEFDRSKEVLVFSSHAHGDHFNAEIYSLFPRASFILSHDIRERRGNFTVMHADESVQIGDVSIKTLNSTDEGVAFIVSCDGKNIFHAGDLNDWVWDSDTKQEYNDMEARFMRETEKLAGYEFDAAFLPLDPRQDDFFSYGFDRYMRICTIKSAVPMHYWDDPSVVERLKKLECSSPYRDKITYIKEGASYEL